MEGGRSGTSWLAASAYRPSVRNSPSFAVSRSWPLVPENPERYRTFGRRVTRKASASRSGSRRVRRERRVDRSIPRADDTDRVVVPHRRRHHRPRDQDPLGDGCVSENGCSTYRKFAVVPLTETSLKLVANVFPMPTV